MRRARTFVVAASTLMALVLVSPVANASTTTTTVAPSSTSTCGVAQSAVVRVVSADSPCTVAARVGGSFEIVLRSGWRWGTPVSNSKAVIVSQLTRTSKGVSDAVLTATSVGVATITVTGTIYCAPNKVCPELAMLWTLKVLVTKTTASAVTLRLTSQDIDNTYDARPGDRFIVTLSPTTKYTWSEPAATALHVVDRVAGRSGATASGLFVARSSGRTRLVATQTPNCGTGCGAKPHRFWVNVVVTPKG
jgi:hypothetical protein